MEFNFERSCLPTIKFMFSKIFNYFLKQYVAKLSSLLGFFTSEMAMSS